MNKELESHYEIGRQLDDACSNLQAELQELKQAKWRDQLQQTRKQQQQQLQQQQQQQKKPKENKSEKARVSYTKINGESQIVQWQVLEFKMMVNYNTNDKGKQGQFLNVAA